MLTVNETTNLSADIRDEGQQKIMLHASFGAKSLHIDIEVLDKLYVQEHSADVESDVARFVADACMAAAKAGIPVSGVKD